MSQSSLLTWLNKPGSVKCPPSGEVAQDSRAPTNVSEAPSAAELSSPQNRPDRAKEQADLTFGRRPLPPNVELRSCEKDDIPHLKRLTSLLLPIPYPDKFYKDIINDPITNSITLLAVWHDDPARKGVEKGRLIGAVRCRLLSSSDALSSSKSEGPILYLSTLALLSPYRQHGIATRLLHSIVRTAANNYGVTRVGAHVWEANKEGLEWYRKRGFRETGREHGYYRRLDPSGAIVVERGVSITDLMASQTA